MDVIPIRCFSCGKILASKWEPYLVLLKEGKSEEDAMNILFIQRYCCRRMILSQQYD
jgi:DNA-directed RNA polymerase I, II, and III subunit RPABC5